MEGRGGRGEKAVEQTRCQDLCLHGFLKVHLPNKIFPPSSACPPEKVKIAHDQRVLKRFPSTFSFSLLPLFG